MRKLFLPLLAVVIAFGLVATHRPLVRAQDNIYLDPDNGGSSSGDYIDSGSYSGTDNSFDYSGDTSTSGSNSVTSTSSGSSYDPCFTETPDGCVDSNGYLTGVSSSDTATNSGSTTGGKYNPCVTETPEGCVDSNGQNFGIHSKDLIDPTTGKTVGNPGAANSTDWLSSLINAATKGNKAIQTALQNATKAGKNLVGGAAGAASGTSGKTGATNTGTGSTNGNVNPTALPGAQISADKLFTTILEWIFTILGLTAFIGLVWAGIGYITAGGDTAKAEKARKGILYTLLGVIIAVLAYGLVLLVTSSVSSLSLGGGSSPNSGVTSGSNNTSSTTNSGNGSSAIPVSGSFPDPCVTETPDGCINSDGVQTGLRSDGTPVTAGSSDNGSASVVAGANYGLGIDDQLGTLSGDTLTITDRNKAFNYPYGLTLNSQPAADVTVTVSQTGSLKLRLSDTTFTFTADNYNVPQGLNIAYGAGYKSGDSATITFTGNDGSSRSLIFTIP